MPGSDCYHTCDVRMRVIIHQFEILEFEIEDTFHIRVDFHLRQRTRFAGQLQFDLFQMIQIDMCVTECMNEVSGLQSRHLRYHLQQQCV